MEDMEDMEGRVRKKLITALSWQSWPSNSGAENREP